MNLLFPFLSFEERKGPGQDNRPGDEENKYTIFFIPFHLMDGKGKKAFIKYAFFLLFVFMTKRRRTDPSLFIKTWPFSSVLLKTLSNHRPASNKV